jgi:hypothetical protein
VRVRYLDGGGTAIDVTLSARVNDPKRDIVHTGEPLGSALLGAEEGDEVEVLVGNQVRRAVIERVTKGQGAAPAEDKPDHEAQPPTLFATDEATARQSERSAGPTLKPEQPSISQPKLQLQPNSFYERSYLPAIKVLGTEMIDRLGPVTFGYLSGLIARAHGFQRTGSQIKSQVWAAVSKERKVSRTPAGVSIFWPKARTPETILDYRGLFVGGESRQWSDVPHPEKLGIVMKVLRDGPTEDSAAEIASRIGLTRLKQATRDELEALLMEARTLDDSA